jgi:hypothetical protein
VRSYQGRNPGLTPPGCQAWADHYRWYPQHPLTRRSRSTLKADPEHSSQAQASDGDLTSRAGPLDAPGTGPRAATTRELVLGGVLAEAVPSGVYQRGDLRILPVQGTE